MYRKTIVSKPTNEDHYIKGIWNDYYLPKHLLERRLPLFISRKKTFLHIAIDALSKSLYFTRKGV